jgi:hypothetical protein
LSVSFINQALRLTNEILYDFFCTLEITNMSVLNPVLAVGICNNFHEAEHALAGVLQKHT